MASETIQRSAEKHEHLPLTIDLPAPTAWPIVLAFGITLLFAGLVTSSSVSILGAVFAVAGCVGWFRDVLPHEKHESVLVEEGLPVVATSRPQVVRVEWIDTGSASRTTAAGDLSDFRGRERRSGRRWRHGCPGRAVRNYERPGHLVSDQSLVRRIVRTDDDCADRRLSLGGTYRCPIIHLVSSVLVGLLYGAMLPMFPRRPILLGGVIAPLLWTGLMHSILEVLDPVLNQRIDWFWFVLSQIGFGIVAGIVVSRQERVRTWQFLPFAIRVGIEAPGAMDEKNGDSQSQ